MDSPGRLSGYGQCGILPRRGFELGGSGIGAVPAFFLPENHESEPSVPSFAPFRRGKNLLSPVSEYYGNDHTPSIVLLAAISDLCFGRATGIRDFFRIHAGLVAL